MSLQSRIETKLNTAFSPERLIVVNESHLHAGHHPDIDGTGETHMRVRIVSSAFIGMSRIARHRAINEGFAARDRRRIACAGAWNRLFQAKPPAGERHRQP